MRPAPGPSDGFGQPDGFGQRFDISGVRRLAQRVIALTDQATPK
jgi:hypothetical protein